MKSFNITGTCRPNEHYMVDITERLEIISKMVSKGDYFCINRGRQYGKTTTLEALSKYLKPNYTVFKLSFEGVSQESFESLPSACAYFLQSMLFNARLGLTDLDDAALQVLEKAIDGKNRIEDLQFAYTIPMLCNANSKPIVILIDEVDQASNFEPFLMFLGVLRKMFLNRNELATFQSVILAGVYDIKNLKLKMRSVEQHQYNSPWNIAVPFDVDMSLSAEGIAGMLAEYKADHHLSFDERTIAQLIRDYTSGYPFLVSRICMVIDVEQWSWDKESVQKAVNKILNEGSTLFDDIVKKLDEFSELESTIRGILFEGIRYPFNYYDKAINLALMFNFIKPQEGAVAISCRLFEIWFYNYFISHDKKSKAFLQGQADKNQFIINGIIDMSHLLERFVTHMNETFSMDKDHEFLENNGRQIFLTYLRPIINGVGNYYIEAQTRDNNRMDVIIDYLGHRYVIELKIWRGNAYNERGEDQLRSYLDYFDLKQGYLLSFCFNQKKHSGLQPPVIIGGRTLIEAIV